jgi:hypothetical protein
MTDSDILFWDCRKYAPSELDEVLPGLAAYTQQNPQLDLRLRMTVWRVIVSASKIVVGLYAFTVLLLTLLVIANCVFAAVGIAHL